MNRYILQNNKTKEIVEVDSVAIEVKDYCFSFWRLNKSDEPYSMYPTNNWNYIDRIDLEAHEMDQEFKEETV